eukprot:Skav200119  [mRNA]  locus=scaffold3069:80857:81263:+ [translate_table: standard]
MPAAMKAMKATKAKKVNTAMKTKGQTTMTKGGLTTSLADATELKKGDISKILNSLAEIGTEEVKNQDQAEASPQGRQEVDVRPGSHGEGPACKDCREGIPRGSSQVKFLRPWIFRPWSCSQKC